MSFLKAGYLALFRTFGYGLVARTVFDPVREQLRMPENSIFDTLVGPQKSAATDRAIILKAVLEPLEHRVLIVTFQGFVVRPGDADAVDVNVHLPCPGEAALQRHRRWCETVRSGSKAPVTLLTESDTLWVDGTLGWYPQTEQGVIEVFPPALKDQLTQTCTHTV